MNLFFIERGIPILFFISLYFKIYILTNQLLEIVRIGIHYSLHLLIPGLIAFYFYRKHWKKVWLLFIATMLVDLDHLVANPIFDPNRCSINFHPLHSYYAMGIYSIMLYFPKTRIIGVALLFHMFTDFLDCLWIS